MIDTLKMAKSLEKAGMERQQAEAMAEALAESGIVTKDDLESAFNKFAWRMGLTVFAIVVSTQAAFTSILIQAFLRHLHLKP